MKRLILLVKEVIKEVIKYGGIIQLIIKNFFLFIYACSFSLNKKKKKALPILL